MEHLITGTNYEQAHEGWNATWKQGKSAFSTIANMAWHSLHNSSDT